MALWAIRRYQFVGTIFQNNRNGDGIGVTTTELADNVSLSLHNSFCLNRETNLMLFMFSSRTSGKLKAVKINVYCLSQDFYGFPNSAKELSFWQPGRVADLPNNAPNSRGLLGNGFRFSLV